MSRRGLSPEEVERLLDAWKTGKGTFDSFVLYKNWLDLIDEEIHDGHEKWELIKLFARYALTGVAPQGLIGTERVIWLMAQPQIKTNVEKRLETMKIGAKGGAPIGNQNAKKKEE